MACIRKRKNNWIVDYRLGSVRKTPSFNTKSEAEAFKRELLLRPLDVSVGYSPLIEMSVKDAVQEYLLRVTVRKADKTHAVDRIALGRLCEAFDAQMLWQISFREIELLQLGMVKELNPSTVNRQFNVIKHFFKKCLEWNYLNKSPTERLSKLKEITKPKKPLSDEQINKILQELPDWAVNVFYFISRTGLRRGQACSLKWENVDLSRKVFETRSIKGGHEKKYEIPMTESTHRIFLEQLNLKQRSFRKSEFVFVGENGAEIKPLSFSQAVSRVGKKLGIDNAGVHILRHTLITRLGENNNNGATIQRIAGHSSLVTTQIYLHPSTEEMRASLESLEQRQQIKRRESI